MKSGKTKEYSYTGYMHTLAKHHLAMRKIVLSAPDKKAWNIENVDDIPMNEDGVIDMSVVNTSGFRRTHFQIEHMTVFISDVSFKDKTGKTQCYEGLTFAQKKKTHKKGERSFVDQTLPSKLALTVQLAMERVMQLRGIPTIPLNIHLNTSFKASTPKVIYERNRTASAQTLGLSSIASVDP
jgi:hypothetical protein